MKVENMREENILRSYGIKLLAFIYMTGLTIFLSYYISKVYEEVLWDNERVAKTAFISISFMVSLIYFVVTEKSILRSMFLYHFVLLGTVACIFTELSYMPFVLMPMIVTAVCGLKAGLVTSATVGSVLFEGMIYYPEYVFGVILTVLCVASCFAVCKKNSMLKNAAGVITYLMTEFLSVMFFKHYCVEIDVVYRTTSYVVISMITAVACVVVANVAGMLLKWFIYKETPDFYIRKISSADYAVINMMKRKSTSLYYHSTEVAELARVAARRIGANEALAYAGGIYHDIGKLTGQEYIKEGLLLAEKYNLPNNVRAIMVEHNVKSRLPRSKESAIVMLCDTAVSAVEYLKGTMDKKEMSEKTIVENALNKRIISGALHKSGLTIEEFDIIKEVLVKVKEKQ